MSSQYRLRPLPCADVRSALTNLGFTQDKQGSTNHEQWRCIRDGKLHKVTVSCHGGEVRILDLKSIFKQAGVSKKEFIDAI